jgi:hypothetical protein
MRKHVILGSLAALVLAGGVIAVVVSTRDRHPGPGPGDPSDDNARAAAPEGPAGDVPSLPVSAGVRADAKPLSDTVKKGLAYLVKQQRADGGWGQGGGWRTATEKGGRVEGAGVEDPSDVGNTCIAALALLRAGNTPKQGPYAENVARAVAFICKHVEKSDQGSLSVTEVRNTQLQSKIGPYIDTFLAALVLAEVKGQMPQTTGERQLLVALNKTVSKIEKNQKADGTWANEGWAAIISQGLAAKGLNRARQSGVAVSDVVLARAETWGKLRLEAGGGVGGAGKGGGSGAVAMRGAGAGPGDAGVPLYGVVNSLSATSDSVVTNRTRAPELEKKAADPKASDKERAKARNELVRFKKAETELAADTKALAGRLESKEFVDGFGSDGGEEFLTYMSISETLLAKGGEEWKKWDRQVSARLARARDQDGGWSGHHCITGKTFCTSAALLVLMADRAPIPLAAKIKEGK